MKATNAKPLLAALILGVFTTIAVAWFSVGFIDLYHADRSPIQMHSNAAAPAWSYSLWRSRTAAGVLSIDSSLSGAARTADFGPGPSWSRTSLPPVTIQGEEYSARYEEARGWPMLALDSIQVSTDMSLTSWRTKFGVALPMLSGIYDVPRTLGFTPILPGFAINSILYGIVWVMAIALITRVVRYRRRRDGACAQCGYPVTDLNRCPECGLDASSGPSEVTKMPPS